MLAAALLRHMGKLEITASSFHADYAPTKGRWSERAKGSERWVKPELVAEVGFTELTPEGHVRHPTFKGLRTDKPASKGA